MSQFVRDAPHPTKRMLDLPTTNVKPRRAHSASIPGIALCSALAITIIDCSGSQGSKATDKGTLHVVGASGAGGNDQLASGDAGGDQTTTAGRGVGTVAGGGRPAVVDAKTDTDAGATGGPDDQDGGDSGLSGTVDAAAAADSGGTSESDVSLATISMRLGGAICDSLLSCLGSQKLIDLFSRESCATRIVSGLAENDLSALDDSIQKGRVTLHPELLAACYADTRALGCAVQTMRLPVSCQAAIEGHVAIGATCSIGSDCSGEAFCSTGACPRTCTALRSIGDGCSRDEECKSGLVCNSGTCGAPAAIDAACAGDSGAVCAFGASCVGGTSTQTGTCKKNSDIQIGALGDSCSPGGPLCQEGLSCAFDGSSAFNCQAAAAANQACHLAYPTECPVDQYCDEPDAMTPGHCVPLPSDGTACALSNECAPGNLCVTEDSKNICRRLGDLGDDCKVDGLCRSGSCISGKCAAPPLCE